MVPSYAALWQNLRSTKDNRKRRGKRPLRAETLETRVMCSANTLAEVSGLASGNVLLAAAAIVDDAPNTVTSTAPTISLNAAGTGFRSGTLEVAGDHDIFRVNISSSGSYQFNQIGTSLSNSYLRLLNAQGRQVAADDNSGGGLNSRITCTLSAGTYYLEAGAAGDSLAGAYDLSVTKLPPPNTPPKVARAARAASSTVSGVSTTLSVLGSDNAGEAALSYTWSLISSPVGASSPTFSINGSNAAKNTAITFSAAGTYRFAVSIRDAGGLTAASYVNVTVKQTLSGIVVTPLAASVQLGATQQFTAKAIDQFGRNMTSQPKFTWTTNFGKITSTGLYTAPNLAGTATITAKTGTKSAAASVTINAPANGILDAQLSSLFTTLYADGSISRNDMIQLLRTAGNDDGKVDATELADLRGIVAKGATYQMANYVQVLAGDVVNGNAANAYFGGRTLGNLTAGSSAAQMNSLVDKWFLGADHPATSYTYRSFAGSLFVNGPAYNDSNQGYLGDCYFIASLDAIAKSSPTAIQNMFIDNGDNTWTVRFYANGTADYVTVDRYLPTYGNYAVFADARGTYSSTGTELWMPLAEKAYAQWNETGKEGRDGKNSYASIEGGWMQTVCQQVLGKASQVSWWLPDSDKAALIAAVSANKAVTYATNGNPGNGMVGPHAYVVQSYNASNDTFQLYNPWGNTHPGALTYAQLRASGQCFVIADASASVPASLAKAGGVGSAVASQTLAAASVAAVETHLVDAPRQTDVTVGPTAASPTLADATDRAISEALAEPSRDNVAAMADAGPRAQTWTTYRAAVAQSLEKGDVLDLDGGLTQLADLLHAGRTAHGLATLG